MFTPRHLSLVCFALVTACGSTPPPPPAAYSAAQLNAVAPPSSPDEFGPTATSGAIVGGESVPPPDLTPPPPASVRVIQASPDRVNTSLSFYLDSNPVAMVQGLAYKRIAGYSEVIAGDHVINVRGARAAGDSNPAASLPSRAFESGRQHTAIVYGQIMAPPALTLAVDEDDNAQPEAGQARVRFFHALIGQGAVDVCLPPVAARPGPAPVAAQPATPVFANVAYGAFGTPAGGQGHYFTAPAGRAVTLQIRAQNARPCAGLVRGTVTVNPADRAVVTAVAAGRAVGVPPVARELLVCTDAPLAGSPSCAAVPIR